MADKEEPEAKKDKVYRFLNPVGNDPEPVSVDNLLREDDESGIGKLTSMPENDKFKTGENQNDESG